jgi:hypothetical protein
MKNDSGAKEDLLKGRKSSATSDAIAQKHNDRRSALGDQHLWEPSNIGIGHRAINSGRDPLFHSVLEHQRFSLLIVPDIITGE